jgi:hypothetical protein
LRCRRERRTPEKTVRYVVVSGELETLLGEAREDGRGLPRYVENEFRAFMKCGILESGFARCVCQDCGDEIIVAFSCKACPEPAEGPESKRAREILDELGIDGTGPPLAPARVPHQLECVDLLPDAAGVDPCYPD